MEKLVLWESDYKDPVTGKFYGKLLNPVDIYEAVSTFEFRFIMFPDVPGDKASVFGLPEGYQDMGEDELIEALEELVGGKSQHASDDYVQTENILCFDLYENQFFNLEDCETATCYSYFCNSNWITITFDEAHDTSIELEMLDTYSLDIWDGSNHYYPRTSTGNHAILEKVLADEEPALLWHEWSQWSGSELDTGYLLTKEEALEALKDHPEIDEIREWLSK
jgi:hypothetical protein